MLNYPDRFPAIHNANDCRWCWEEPLASDSFQLAKGLESAANSIQHEAGHCHQSYSCLEAAHRLKETVRILSSDAPSYEQLNAIQKLHSSKCGECDGTGRVGDLGPGGIYRNGKQVNNESARCDDCGGTGISWQNAEVSRGHPNNQKGNDMETDRPQAQARMPRETPGAGWVRHLVL